MAWKEINISNSSGMTNWSGDGPPNVSTQLTPLHTYVVNVPIDGGEGTIISSGITGDTLKDGIKTSNAYYTYNSISYPVQMLSDGNGIAMEFSNNQLIEKLFIFTPAVNGSTINTNTFYIMISNDLTNWSLKETIISSNVSFDLSNLASGYGVINIILSTPLLTKYIYVRSLNNLDITNTSADYIREFECYSPNGSFGAEGDEYRDNLNGKKYKKINNEWVLIFTPQQIPAHIVGNSPSPPSAIGLAEGSLYFVRSN